MLLQTPVAWYLLPEARMSKFRLCSCADPRLASILVARALGRRVLPGHAGFALIFPVCHFARLLFVGTFCQ